MAVHDFNPRAREGRDTSQLSQKLFVVDFNPRAREGRDIAFLKQEAEEDNFNPRAREGRDNTKRRKPDATSEFQSTRP